MLTKIGYYNICTLNKYKINIKLREFILEIR